MGGKQKTIDFRQGGVFLFLGFFCLLLAVVFNPFGLKLVTHVYELSQSNYIKSMIFEWKSPFSDQVRATRIFLVYILILCVLMLTLIFRFHKLSLHSWILLLVFGFMSTTAQRHIAILAIVSVIPLAEMTTGIIKRDLHKWIFLLLTTAFMLSLIIAVQFKGNVVSVKPGFYRQARIPEQTIEYMQKVKMRGNLMNTYPLGGQLIYHFYPQARIVIDSRVDAYGEKYMNFYQSIWSAPYKRFSAFLQKHEIRNIILDIRMFMNFRRSKNLKQLIQDKWFVAHANNKVVIISKL